MSTKKNFRIPLIGILLSVMAFFMLMSFNKTVSHAAEGDYLTFTAEEDATISFNWQKGSNVQTSTDGGKTWSDYSAGTSINLAKNSSISFKANNIETSSIAHFNITGKVAASGDVTSLTNGKGGDCQLSKYCYFLMFRNCIGLTSAPALPATTLANYCYYEMFEGCTRLTSAPALPATTLADYCYDNMFEGCTSLTSAPTLSATTLADYCYSRMFYGCTSLTTAPALPATTLADSCYDGMFEGCTSLTTAPALPATTLADSCYYYMFYGCTSLTTAPALPATTLADSCYFGMFNGCTSLTTAPALPATTLAKSCYANMFFGCKGLTSVPELPAINLTSYCYDHMFQGCSSIEIKSSGSGKEWSIPEEASFSESQATNWNYQMFLYTKGDVKEPEPGVTYYISADTTALIKSFVTRLYKVCLDRAPDEDGLNNWVNALESGEKTGVDVASGFIFSTEFNNHNYCNSCYVEHLYNAFMGRASDPDGKAYWINNLETGMTREEVFNGFALSPEFKNICDEYGIVQGEGLTIPEYGTVPKGSCSADGTVDGVTSFVTRLYNVCLDRDPDATGLSNWTNALWNHETSGSTTAQGFIFSPEFTNKNYDDDTYVEYLYRAFFDRASDPAGKAYWVSKLQNGASREEVFNGFTGSQEFMTLCAKYGIVR